MKFKLLKIRGRKVGSTRRPDWFGVELKGKKGNRRAISLFRILIRRNR